MRIVRFHGLYPSGAFMLFLLGAALFLLRGEIARCGPEEGSTEARGWVRIRAPGIGSSFYSFPAGEVLEELVLRALPRLSGRLSERCRTIPLAEGTEIRLEEGLKTGERSCLVVPLPERCRYLMGMPLNVNRCGAEELELLPGIGPALAGRIIAVRESKGPFSSSIDLVRVPGIGGRLLEAIVDRICFSNGEPAAGTG